MKENCAQVLLDHSETRESRARAWNEFVSSRKTILPFLDTAMRKGVEIPVELHDHYLARMWLVTERKTGWKDVQWSDICNFGVRWVEKEDCTDIATRLIKLTLQGKKIDFGLFRSALLSRDLRNLCSMIRQHTGLPVSFGYQQLLFYACACWPEDAALEAIERVERESSGLPGKAVDALGRNALWYALYRGHHFDQEFDWDPERTKWNVVKEVLCVNDPIPAALMALGCDPEIEPRGMGLSWRDIIEAKDCR